MKPQSQWGNPVWLGVPCVLAVWQLVVPLCMCVLAMATKRGRLRLIFLRPHAEWQALPSGAADEFNKQIRWRECRLGGSENKCIQKRLPYSRMCMRVRPTNRELPEAPFVAIK